MFRFKTSIENEATGNPKYIPAPFLAPGALFSSAIRFGVSNLNPHGCDIVHSCVTSSSPRGGGRKEEMLDNTFRCNLIALDLSLCPPPIRVSCADCARSGCRFEAFVRKNRLETASR